MSLWVDKYRPSTLAKLDYHREQAERLEKMVAKGNFPHLLIYGPPGAGKKTRVMALLRELYGPGVEKLRMEHQNFTVITFSIFLSDVKLKILEFTSHRPHPTRK